MADHDPLEATQSIPGESDKSPAAAAPSSQDVQSCEHPERIGRYRVEGVLGKGGFGLVYLALDEQLDRRVAVKVPHKELVSTQGDAEAYLTEARTVANLDHAHIVPVYDVGSMADFPCYVVSKYVEGTDLTTRLKQSRLKHAEAAKLVATVAEALHYAHKQGLVHRDVKPGNILIGDDNKPHVVDFGLALREENIGKDPRYAGTPAYMSPEQARGEGHRVDGRSDIFSLGVVFYELLVGRRTFSADTQAELLEQITSQEVKPPRQINDAVPKELERICLKALSKRASERYTTALDMAEDLRQFLADQPSVATTTAVELKPDSTQVSTDSSKVGSDSQPIRIVPKGLRSFDEHDADFFLELLPGPRDREGLPDSIRFWKTRIEETDADKTFSVGLIYGPSGCGKSSMVKAGLLPRLADHVTVICVEATANDTETRLIRGLRKRCGGLPEGLSLRQTLAALRRGEGLMVGQKVLIVLDQFEQWLHSNRDKDNTELVQSLRQCDGGNVQCVVMVRDDFWMAVSRFMRDLEVPLVEGHNSALVDLFPVRHAQRVLAAFGRAFGVLPEDTSKTTKEQRTFLKQSTAGLAEEGKVICVRLALFAEMMKTKPWTPTTLREVGGAEGVGVTFLEDSFSASTAPPEHRYHQKAARAVLKALLPGSGTDIKGHMRSYAELLEASGYGTRPKDFDDLIRILDSEIRLITPTDPEGKDPDDESVAQTEAGKKYFQLTHDYLVPSLRDWLTRKQKETRRGRAELRLAERSALWNAKPENSRLPSVFGYLNIRALTDKSKWTEPQRTMMRKAGRIQAVRWGTALMVLLLVGITGERIISSERRKNQIQNVKTAIDTLQNSSGKEIPFTIRDLNRYPQDLVLSEFASAFSLESEGSRKLALAYALATHEQIEYEYLVRSVGQADDEDCTNMIAALHGAKEQAVAEIVEQANTATNKQDWKLKARLAILAMHLGDVSVATDVYRIKDRPDPTQQTVFIHDVFPTWHDDLKKLAKQVEDLEDGSLRAGLALAMGNLPADEMADAQSAWQDLMTKWYLESPDSGTHSAAGWALRQWNVDLPEVMPDTTDPPHRNWKVTPHGFSMILIPAGEFERTDGKTKQKVTLTRDLWLSDVEVTVGLFQEFMADRSYQGLKPKDWEGVDEKISPTKQHPAQRVSWEDAVLFCTWLSEQDNRTPCYQVEWEGSRLRVELLPHGTGYRLPTEAEWEYACRAGTTTEYGFGNDAKRLEKYAVFQSTKSEVSASKMCNRWGLFDIHGNVWEWCHDWYGDYADEKAADPRGPLKGSHRVSRGGSWNSIAGRCQAGRRNGNYPSHRHYYYGFRLAQVPLPVKKTASAAKSESR